MEGAEADQVAQVGVATFGPVDDVVHFDVPVGSAAGEAAPVVPVMHEAAGAARDDALSASDVDGVPGLLDDRDDQPVTREFFP